MHKSRDFRNLQVWQKAHALVLGVYERTKEFPKVEMFGLTSQMRKAAVSIPANMAEGCGRGSPAELARFMDIAHGSASELSYYFILGRDLKYLQPNEADLLDLGVDEVKRMLAAYTNRIRG